MSGMNTFVMRRASDCVLVHATRGVTNKRQIIDNHDVRRCLPFQHKTLLETFILLFGPETSW